MAKAKVWSAEKSGKNLKSDATTLARAHNAAWGTANKAALFLRKAKMVGTGKNRKRATMKSKNGETRVAPQRLNRCFRQAATNVLLSGAAESVAAILKSEAETMNVAVEGEVRVAAALPKMSKPAELAFEHALAAYTQTIFAAATSIKGSIKQHSKVTAGCMAAAVEIANKRIFSATTLAPGVIVPSTMKKPKASKKAPKEEKTVPEKEAAA
jgi:hypothetical protein